MNAKNYKNEVVSGVYLYPEVLVPELDEEFALELMLLILKVMILIVAFTLIYSYNLSVNATKENGDGLY